MKPATLSLTRACVAMALTVLFCQGATSAGRAAEAGVRQSLFDGQDLDQWQVSGCEAVVENGLLVLKAGDGLVRSNERHGDFILELDWRAKRPTNYDSGIYIRSELPAAGKPWPDKYQINLKQGAEGNLLALEGAKSTGLIKPGDWNHFKITVIGDTASLEINGKPAWQAKGLVPKDGYIGLQAEVDGGGAFEFRNIVVTDLDYQSLFNGQDLTGWVGSTDGYGVEDGAIFCKPKGGGNLYTAEEYADFSYRFDFKLTPGGNNGVGIRAPLKGDAAFVGIESQILDDSSDLYKNAQPWQAHGSIYGVVPAKKGFLKPVGQWNHEEIIARGRHITVILNGATIVDANIDEASKNGTLDGKAHPGLARTQGHIGFLGHGARIDFRHMRIKKLDAPQAGESAAQSKPTEKLKALIIDGQNNHDWKATTPVLKRELESSGRFTVDVATSPPGPDTSGFRPRFSDYQVVVSNYNGADWPKETQQDLIDYVKAGGGLVIVHAANNAFGNWKEYNQMIGLGGWGGRNEASGPYVRFRDNKIVRDTKPGAGGHHGAQHPFQVVIRDTSHPITAGLPTAWLHETDELYDQLRGPAENMTVLATAYADPKQGGSGEHEPMLLTVDYGKGRVFHTPMGHSAQAMQCVGFIVTLLRGAEWAATGQVTPQAVPADFPGPDRVSLRK